MKLFQIDSRIEELDAIIEESGGEITPEQEMVMDRLLEDYDNQMGWIHSLIKQRDADAKAAKDMEQHFKRKRVAAEKSVAWWKSVVMVALTKKNLTKWSTFIGKLSICNNSAVSARLVDDKDIPQEFARTTVEFSASAAAERYKQLVEDHLEFATSDDKAEALAAEQMLVQYRVIVERGTHVRV